MKLTFLQASQFLSMSMFLANLPATATVIPTSITIDHSLQFGPNFSGATWQSNVTITLDAISSGTKDFDLSFWPDNYGLTFFSTGGVTIDQTTAPAGTSSRTVHVMANGTGTFGFHETAGPEADPSSGDPLLVYTSLTTNRQILDFGAPSGGYSTHLDPGITWTTTTSMPGDWSASGVDSGNHYLFVFDPLWTVTSDFVFDPSTNQTLFSLVNTNYPGANSGDNGPYPDFALIGTAVPEQSEAVLVVIGCCAIYALRRMTSTGQPSPSRLRVI